MSPDGVTVMAFGSLVVVVAASLAKFASAQFQPLQPSVLHAHDESSSLPSRLTLLLTMASVAEA